MLQKYKFYARDTEYASDDRTISLSIDGHYYYYGVNKYMFKWIHLYERYRLTYLSTQSTYCYKNMIEISYIRHS